MRRNYRRQKPKEEKAFRANEQIKLSEVFLIDVDGERLGVVPMAKAVLMAEEAGFDLVEVDPKAQPPIVKIMDFGKVLYEKKKKQSHSCCQHKNNS
jgi:translation initiation factor IF-3